MLYLPVGNCDQEDWAYTADGRVDGTFEIVFTARNNDHPELPKYPNTLWKAILFLRQADRKPASIAESHWAFGGNRALEALLDVVSRALKEVRMSKLDYGKKRGEEEPKGGYVRPSLLNPRP